MRERTEAREREGEKEGGKSFSRKRREKLSHLRATGFRSRLPDCANRASHFWAAALTQRDASSSGSSPRQSIRLNYHAKI